MQGSFTQFVTGLIDYAGLFPPAGLDMTAALADYAGILAGESGWMLGRFIVPATQLNRVGRHPGYRYSVIVSPAIPEDELEQLSTFNKAFGRVETVETRLPENADSAERCSDHLLHVKSRLNRAGLLDVQLFMETGNLVPAALLASSLAAFNARRDGGKIIANAGFKLRCGGVKKEAFPTVGQVAGAIAVCRRHDIPIRFTAGIHHPLRSRSPLLAVMQHGFLNIFAASLLAWGRDLSTAQLAACLDDAAVEHFRFAEESFTWQAHTISADEIRRLRRNRVMGFGSCSFAEPVAGLRSLGFLGQTGT